MRTIETELVPQFENRKSYYGKALIENDGKKETLISYRTPVLELNLEDGSVKRLWQGWSATTGRHIKEYCKQRNIDYSKKWWDSL